MSLFLIDSLLAAPVRGLLWVAEKIRERAEEERANDEASLRLRLADLNRRLELAQIDEVTFIQDEAALIARLEHLWARQDGSADQSDTEPESVENRRE